MEEFYIKYNKVIKRVLIVPATIIAGGIIIVSIGGMAIMGGIVLVGYIIISVGECIVQNVTCIKKCIFNIQEEEEEEEEIRVANVEISNNSNSFTDVTELSGVSLALRIAPVIEVKIMGGEQEQEQEQEQESYMLPIAIVVSKQKIIPCMDII